jgi:TetR/AcrR family transcriptional regulator, cholesterol catabolism regulator
MVRELPTRSLEDRRGDERYQRLMAATRQAARLGYDAVSMRELAKQTHMSMTTIYQYCSSKDHLIAEAHLEWMERFRSTLESKPSRARTARARVLAYIAEIVRGWEQHEVLIRTLQRAVYSMDPGVAEVRASMRGTYARIMELAIGHAPVADPTEVAEIIGHVIDSVTFRWVSGTVDNHEGRKIMERAVRTLLPN